MVEPRNGHSLLKLRINALPCRPSLARGSALCGGKSAIEFAVVVSGVVERTATLCAGKKGGEMTHGHIAGDAREDDIELLVR